MAPRYESTKVATRLSFNADAAAIFLALAFAALVRLNVIHQIGW